MRKHVRAGFSGIYIQSYEHEDALRELGRLCHDEGWQCYSWNASRGLSSGTSSVDTDDVSAHDPLAAVRILSTVEVGDASAAILVLENFHRFLNSAEIVQAVADQVQLGKIRHTFLVILAPVVELPPELEKLFVTIEHELPDRDSAI